MGTENIQEDTGNWTVIGFWVDDEPVVAGVVAGSQNVEEPPHVHNVLGAYPRWNIIVEGKTAAEAEDRAVTKMLDTVEYQEAITVICPGCGTYVDEGVIVDHCEDDCDRRLLNS